MPWKNGDPPLYSTWQAMLSRCYCKTKKQYKDYGGRGIKVCPQWRHNFKQFAADMGPKPTPQHTLDRYPDTNGDYTPKNCRWATRKQQQRNQTVTRKVTIEGVEYIAADLADISGHKTDIIVRRANEGLSYEAVINPGFLSWNTGRPKTHCRNGHEYTLENTKITSQGRRACRKCMRISAQRGYWRDKKRRKRARLITD